MKAFKWILFTVVMLAAAAIVFAYHKVTHLEVEKITEDVHVIYGFGGNVGVLRTTEGTVIVDSMTFKIQGGAVRERAEQLTGKPVVMVINTHYHADHTHGNPAFAHNVRIVATERTAAHMKHTDPQDYFTGDNASFLPNETFSAERLIKMGNKTVRVVHPGRGHTDGDLVALFVEDRVLHMGDLYFNRMYPNIDLEAGGSTRLWVDSMERALALSFDKVIPGHGKVSGAAEARQFQAFIRQLWSVGRDAAAQGLSLEQVLQSKALTEDAGYEEIGVPLIFSLNRAFVLRRAWEEATGSFRLKKLPGH